MKNLFLSIALAICFGTLNAQSGELSGLLKKGHWVDLTYSFSESTLYWPNNKITFDMDTLFCGHTPTGFYYSSYQFCTPEHGGTHLDAPVHFAENKLTTDQILLENLMGDAVIIDISKQALSNRDYLITIKDIEQWEQRNGTLEAFVIVLFRTGYGQFYPDAEKYFGTAARGENAVPLLHFPGLDPEAADWLVKNRKIKAVGLDTPSIDYGQSKEFRSHRILLGQNIPVFENVANLHLLPEKGAYVMAMPMKIKAGSGGPLRIAAWVKN